jgi:dephospho-CoA kinase
VSGRPPWGARWWRTDRYLPRDEPLRAAFRPSPWYILLHAPAILITLLLLAALGAAWGTAGPGAREAGWIVTRICAAAIALHLVLGVARWLSRLYAVTDRRIIIVAGVLSQNAADVPLQRIQHATITRTLAERLLGLGTVGVATAGADGPAVRMLMVRRPDRVAELVRVGAASAPPSIDTSARPARRADTHPGIVVLGMAGGIGAGKSEVARRLGALGCVVIDSDAEAKAALDRPEVRDQLVAWWGTDILDADGRISRSRIAEIIFRDPDQRSRLEGLVHPIVRTRRAEAISRARAAGARAAVIDAPLLFEAGADAECDAVIWVEASDATRLARVLAHRNWDEAEMERRQAAQWPIERKRQMCRYVIQNEDCSGLDERVRAVLDQALAEFGATG